MEDFIIEAKVLAAEHMHRLSPNQQLKYLKRYDIPHNNSRKIAQPFVEIKSNQRVSPSNEKAEFSCKKIRNLLSNINGEQVCDENQVLKGQKSIKITHLFRTTKRIYHKLDSNSLKKDGWLLSKKIEPMHQIYDSNMNAVTKKSPSWSLVPRRGCSTVQQSKRAAAQSISAHDRILIENEQVKLRRKIHKIKSKRHVLSKMQIMKSLRETEDQKVLMRAEQQLHDEIKQNQVRSDQSFLDLKLQYSSMELARYASQIFKKYHFENQTYFKKILAEVSETPK